MDEKTFYTKWYSKTSIVSKRDSLADLWTDELYPERKEVLERMGDLSGKTVLCLGNGKREKELFLSNCRRLIISDIVTESISCTKEKAEDDKNILFCVIDAYKMPVKPDSVDIVYGWQMTHHLAELDDFFDEVKRVLKPGGKAVFVDNAYAPVWQFIKWKMLRPLTDLFLKKRGVSDRDLEFSIQGDYREDDLKKEVRKKGFNDFRTVRFNFIGYVFLKFIRDVFKIQVTKKDKGIYQIARAFSHFDSFMGHYFNIYRKNLRNMVWSFNK